MASYLLIGGVRSGKSSWAANFARRCKRKTMIATAQPCDDDMRKRIENHQRERGHEWTTIEEGIHLLDAIQRVADDADIIVVDCLTVWTASLLDQEQTMDTIINRWVDPLAKWIRSVPTELVFVTNEVGLGVHPAYESGRKYRDLLGTVNQHFAQACDTVIWFMAGIPVAIKGHLPEG